MKTTHSLRSFLTVSVALVLPLMTSTADAAAIIATNGRTVGGTTTILNLNLTATAVGTRPIGGIYTTLANDVNGNLLFTPNSSTIADYNVQWNNLSINTNVHRYAQVTFSAVTAGAVNAGWETFFADGDSTIGGAAGTNSVQAIGTGIVGTAPFSIVIDMTALTGANGGTTGAKGWGATDPLSDNVTSLRFDMFQNLNNFGKTFTISEVRLGSELVPEPSSALLGALGALCLLRRRR
jgi:hypothetical protein